MADGGEDGGTLLNNPIGGDAEPEEKLEFKMITEELKEEIEECFDIFDKDKDGMINYVELGTLLRWLKFNPTERELKDFAHEFDRASTNLVGKQTVMKIVDRKMLDTDTIDELVEAMKLFDTDRDGRLNVPELRWAMTKLGDVMDEGIVDEMIKEVDSDADGLIDIIEFAKICFNIKEKDAK
jgi:Ca2+-binding EF-hand superfamily protein